MPVPDSTNVELKPSYRSVLLLLGSLVAALILTILVKEPTFSDSQVYVIFLLFFAVGLWLTEAIPPFAVGIFILAYLVFAMGNKYFNSSPEPIDRYVNTFSSSVIWLLLGGFFLARAMTKTGLDSKLMMLTLRLSGTRPRNILIALMFTTMVISMFMSNAATTAMVLAATLPIVRSFGHSKLSKALLLGIAVAATTGGMATIIGNPPNVLAAGMIEKKGIEFQFMDWMIYGLPLAILFTILMCWVLLKVFVKDDTRVSLDLHNKVEVNSSLEGKRDQKIVAIVITITLLFWLTSAIHGISVAAISAIPLVVLTVTGILTGEDVKKMPWDMLLLVAGGLSLGVALQYTGIMDHYAAKIQQLQVSPFVFILILSYATMLMTSIMSDTAASTIFIPMAMAILPGFEKQVAVIIALSASTAMFLPVSTTSNSIVYSTGYLVQKDFRVVALLLGLLGPIAAILWIVLLGA